MFRQRYEGSGHDIPPAELGNNGIVLYIADNDGKHVGKFRIGQATVEWCKGRTQIGNGRRIRMHEFIDKHLEQI